MQRRAGEAWGGAAGARTEVAPAPGHAALGAASEWNKGTQVPWPSQQVPGHYLAQLLQEAELSRPPLLSPPPLHMHLHGNDKADPPPWTVPEATKTSAAQCSATQASICLHSQHRFSANTALSSQRPGHAVTDACAASLASLKAQTQAVPSSPASTMRSLAHGKHPSSMLLWGGGDEKATAERVGGQQAGALPFQPQKEPFQCCYTQLTYTLDDEGKGLGAPMMLPCGHHLSRQGADLLLAGGAAARCRECYCLFGMESVTEHHILHAALQPHAPPSALIAAALTYQLALSSLSLPLPPPFSKAQNVSMHMSVYAGKDVVVKRFAMVSAKEQAMTALWEVVSLTLLQGAGDSGTCPVVKLCGWVHAGIEVLVVMDRCTESLRQLVERDRGPGGHATATAGLPQDRAVALAFSLSRALHAMHTRGNDHVQGVLHGFVQPDNILLTGTGDDVVLCGLSNCALLTPAGAVLMPPEPADDSEFCAVEVIRAADADGPVSAVMSEKADVWGLAVSLLFMLTGASSRAICSTLRACHVCCHARSITFSMACSMTCSKT
jgi:hypothetical protein